MRERLNIFIIVLLAGLFSIAFPVDAQVIINEFLADNALTNFDDDGDNEDWVELYNQGDEDVDLQGYFLSDNPENPLRWELSLIHI